MIVADAGPLIGLARIHRLELLRVLYEVVTVPPQVHEELQIGADRPGSRALREAVEAGWLVVEDLSPPAGGVLTGELDAGEAAAIALAEQLGSERLLIDERRGRMVARRHGLAVVGSGGVLVTAKRRGAVSSVATELVALEDAGYRMAPALRERLLDLAGERDEPQPGP